MLTEIEYCSFADYSPRGTSDLAKKSRIMCAAIKAARPISLTSAFPYMNNNMHIVGGFLGANKTLIPVPRSAPLAQGALWPAKVIAETLVANGYGNSVVECIQRIVPVKKSSLQHGAQNRPSVQQHFDSMSLIPGLINSDEVVLIDDVITAGRTAFACAQRIYELYPNITIKVFCFIRTQSFNEIEQLINISQSAVIYNPGTGNTWRHD